MADSAVPPDFGLKMTVQDPSSPVIPEAVPFMRLEAGLGFGSQKFSRGPVLPT
jgi:hypothetical protein